MNVCSLSVYVSALDREIILINLLATFPTISAHNRSGGDRSAPARGVVWTTGALESGPPSGWNAPAAGGGYRVTGMPRNVSARLPPLGALAVARGIRPPPSVVTCTASVQVQL